MARVGNYPWDDTKPSRGGVSHDGGATWTQFLSEPAGSNGSGSVAVSADGGAILWGARDAHLSRSSDGGKTWVTSKGLPEPVKVPDWAPVSLRLASDRVNPKKFYAYDALTGRAYVSQDGGASFEFTTGVLTTLPEYQLMVASIQAVPGLEGHVWATGGKELFFSTDSGQTFSEVPGVEEAYAVGFGLAAPGKSYPVVYLSGKVSGTAGFFRSDDQGASFARINDDAHQYGGSNVIIGDPRVHGRVYIAPGGRGILYGDPAPARP
jgi:xyloglucan-specific exo-beta-1,4-glucanase